MDMRSVLTTGQIAVICSVAPRTVSKWIDSGDLEGYRLPGSNGRRVTVQKLMRFLERHSMTHHAAMLRDATMRRVVVIGEGNESIRKSLEGLREINVAWHSNLLDSVGDLMNNPMVVVLMIGSDDEIAAARLIKQRFGFKVPIVGVVEREDLTGEFRALGFSQVKLNTSRHLAVDLADTVRAHLANEAFPS